MKWAPCTSGRAEADLTNQYRWYLDNANLRVAEGFLAAFDATVARILKVPTLGRSRKFRSAELHGIRSLIMGSGYASHLIFYRIFETTVSVERVMHGARDLERRLLEPPEGYPPQPPT